MDSIPDLNAYVSGGYFLGRPMARAAFMNPELLPDAILTASHCLVDFVPDAWSIAWSGDSPEERQERASRFQLTGAALEEFMDFCTHALETGELGWPSVLRDIEIARRVKSQFFSKIEGLVVFGIALARELVKDFLDETRQEAGHAGVLTALRRGLAPDPSGIALGFDVLGWDWCAFHSYVCNSLENEFASVLNIRPNQYGFFDRIEDARRCADHSNLETTGAEPALWRPWLTVVYDSNDTVL